MKKQHMLNAAITIAAAAHADQYDRGGVPYLMHPLAVMYHLATNDEELKVIAILHDVIEDTDVTYEDLRNVGISDRAIAGIAAMTKLPGETYAEYKIKVMSNRDAMRVKIADLWHNSDIRRLKGVSEKDIARVEKYQKFYLELSESLKSAVD